MIRNIIFDLGGVIINLDMEATARAFRALGMHDFDLHYTQAKQSGLFDAFDKGEISSQEFRDGLKKHLPAETSNAEIDKAWNAMLLDIPQDRLDALQELKKNYRLFLLSNTNEIHVAAFSAYMQEAFGFSDFSAYFEKAYYSCRIGKRKPDAEAFEFVLRENNLLASETLFIDDSQQHVNGAKLAGIPAELLPAGKEFPDLLSSVFATIPKG